MFLTNGLLGTPYGLQHLQKPGCLVFVIDGILNMFGKVAKKTGDIVHVIRHGLAFVRSPHDAPVYPDAIQSVGDSRGFQPIVEGGGAVSSGLPVDHRGSFAVHQQGAFPGIHGFIPSRTTRAEDEFFRSQPQGFLDKAAGKSHDTRALIHLSASLFEDPAAPGGIHTHAGAR